ncbi:hypothetical protein [Nocardioides oleivorans]|jgi:hypothetical protein|nr:hypothetical protein [Nocardioides oleivorans]
MTTTPPLPEPEIIPPGDPSGPGPIDPGQPDAPPTEPSPLP